MGTTIEIPDEAIDITASSSYSGDSTVVRIRLWGITIYSQEYPFRYNKDEKTRIAIEDTKRDFTSKLYNLLKS